VSRRGAYVSYLGYGEFSVRMRVLGSESLRPGSTGAVRLHLPRRLPLRPGDRFVLRESGRAETVGGGEILDVDPRLPAAVARPDRSVDRVVAERGWVRPDDLWRLTGERRVANLAGWVVDPAALRAAQAELRARIAEAGDLGLDLAGLDERERAAVEQLEGVVVEAGRAHPVRRQDTLAEHPFLEALKERPFSPPEPSTPATPPISPEELRELVRRRLAVSVDGVIFAADAVDRAAETVAGLLAARPEGFTVAEFRDAVGTSRKYALPLLAALDASGMTRRRGDLRIAGRRLPSHRSD
ncbi:MAG: SelB C-terminal domain-containing protein, partial [bacterium]|nr:SelB C-terminal domain-containing protein [bacterium]